MKIYFWQKIISPHMAALATELATLGVEVFYLAQQEMSSDRIELGWEPPDTPNVTICMVKNDSQIDSILSSSGREDYHICQGIRGNGYIAAVERKLVRRGRRFLVVMETVEDTGIKGFLRRLMYRAAFRRFDKNILSILAIGSKTKDWIEKRGCSGNKIFPFAYFLSAKQMVPKLSIETDICFSFIFVGQLVHRKRLDLLIEALGELKDNINFKVKIIGSGALEIPLKEKASRALGDRIDWLGVIPMKNVFKEVAIADCLVLPSNHDGWGAVVSEALQVGTPVICSDGCGSAVAVEHSGHGALFRVGDKEDLRRCLYQRLERGKVSLEERQKISNWAVCLSAQQGAIYLIEILKKISGGTSSLIPPWCDIEFGAFRSVPRLDGNCQNEHSKQST